MDLSVYRPTTGYWYIQNSTNGAVVAYRFGMAEDFPVPADYDGDSKADVTVFRPSENAWYRLNSSNGAFVADLRAKRVQAFAIFRAAAIIYARR